MLKVNFSENVSKQYIAQMGKGLLDLCNRDLINLPKVLLLLNELGKDSEEKLETYGLGVCSEDGAYGLVSYRDIYVSQEGIPYYLYTYTASRVIVVDGCIKSEEVYNSCFLLNIVSREIVYQPIGGGNEELLSTILGSDVVLPELLEEGVSEELDIDLWGETANDDARDDEFRDFNSNEDITEDDEIIEEEEIVDDTPTEDLDSSVNDVVEVVEEQSSIPEGSIQEDVAEVLS